MAGRHRRKWNSFCIIPPRHDNARRSPENMELAASPLSDLGLVAIENGVNEMRFEW